MIDLIEIAPRDSPRLVVWEDDLFAVLARYQQRYAAWREESGEVRRPFGHALAIAFAVSLVLWLIILFAAFELIVAGPWR
jgi:hypothetical protein